MVKKDVILADFPENSFIPICNRVDGRLCPTSSMYFKNKYGRVGRTFSASFRPNNSPGNTCSWRLQKAGKHRLG